MDRRLWPGAEKTPVLVVNACDTEGAQKANDTDYRYFIANTFTTQSAVLEKGETWIRLSLDQPALPRKCFSDPGDFFID